MDLPAGFELDSAPSEAPAEAAPDSGLPEGFAVDPDHGLPQGFSLDQDKGQSLGQGVLAGVEGASTGLLGPAATAAEAGLSEMGVPGISLKEQAQRQQDWPKTHEIAKDVALVGGLMSGESIPAKMFEAGSEAAQALKLGSYGSTFLKNAVGSALLAGGDEMTKDMLGPGDPSVPVASKIVNIGGAALLGGGLGIAGQGVLQGLEDAKIGQGARDFLAGMGSKTQPSGIVDSETKAPFLYRAGQFAYDKLIAHPGKLIAGAAGHYLPGGETVLDATILGPYIDKILGKTVTPAVKKVIDPVVIKAMSNGETGGLVGALQHVTDVVRGNNAINSAVDNLFKIAPYKFEEAIDRDKQKIRKYLENGGIDQQVKQEGNAMSEQPTGFARGGEVKNTPQPTDAVATHFPEQSVMLSAAKARVSNYLNSQRPQSAVGKLPYDVDHDTRTQEKKLDRAISIAASPLSILKRVKDGSITTEEIGHLNGMYPELHTQLSKEMTKRITEQQMSGETIPHKTRQGLSMFLGTPLDSSFTPQSIQAAQAVYVRQNQQSADAPQKVKKGTAKLGDASKQARTADQAAQERQVADR